jgi:hypothetical protein
VASYVSCTDLEFVWKAGRDLAPFDGLKAGRDLAPFDGHEAAPRGDHAAAPEEDPESLAVSPFLLDRPSYTRRPQQSQNDGSYGITKPSEPTEQTHPLCRSNMDPENSPHDEAIDTHLPGVLEQ